MKSLTISELVSAIKYNLESSFGHIQVEGEITNLTRSTAGHYYFTLSDKESSISGVLFKFLKVIGIEELKNGDAVCCSGSVSVYAKRGTFQIVAQNITKVGNGKLLLKLEEMKKKLSAQGLFDLKYKKEIPPFPKKVAVITAAQSAALADFLKTLAMRSFFGNVMIIPSVVQGDNAEASLLDAFARATSTIGVDLIVFTRGGGTLEDLWPFNSENLSRAVFNQDIPVISAIGHEVDFTILDYVSDLRVATPTAAATLISSASFSLQERLVNLKRLLLSYMMTFLQKARQRLSPQYLLQLMLVRLSDTKRILYQKGSPRQLERFVNFSSYVLALDEAIFSLDKVTQRLQFFDSRLSSFSLGPSMMAIWERSKLLLANYRMSVLANLIDLNKHKLKLDFYKTRFFNMAPRIDLLSIGLANLYNSLKNLRPTNVLKKGYTILSCDGQIISSYENFERLSPQSSIDVDFATGKGKVKKMITLDT
jgi:exodeoxyribonuclease VII large subunit